MGATSTGSSNQAPRRLTLLEKTMILMNLILIAAILYKLNLIK